MERRMERLTADKLDAFIDLRLTQLKEEGTLETDLRPALEDYLHRHLADGSFVSWILTEGNRILATSGISFVEKPPYPGAPNGRIGLLSCMYTDPACRRQGIAGKLLQVFLDFAKGNHLAFLSLEVRASNYDAIALYGSRGFRSVGRRKNYYEHPREDAIIMTKEFEHHGAENPVS